MHTKLRTIWRPALEIVFLVAAALASVYWPDILAAGVSPPMHGWLYESTDLLEREVAIVNAAFGASLYLLFRVVFVPILSFFLVTAVTVGFAAISLEKVRQLGMPLLPWDLWFAADIKAFLTFASIDLKALSVVLSVLLLAAWLIMRLKLRLLNRPRISATLFGIAPIALWVFSTIGGHVESLSLAGIHNITWDQKASFNNYGPFYTFFSNWRYMSLGRPDKDYLLAAQNVDDAHIAAEGNGSQPDVIAILSESFTDLPIRIFKQPFSCLSTAPAAQLITPAWGGFTANVEFELLTGYPHAVFPVGSVPYQMYIKRPLVHALPAQFVSRGYDASALHTYARSFFSRPKAYQMMGFARYDGVEDFDRPRRKGYFVDDQVLFDEILQRLDEPDRKPQFIHAVSMMAHQPYGQPNRYPVLPQLEGLLPPELEHYRLHLTQYGSMIYDHERMLCAFLAELTRRERRTVVLFYGDHYPTFGSVDVYREINAVLASPDRPFDLARDYSRPPLVLFDSKKGFIKLPDAVPGYNLGTILMREAGIPLRQLWTMPHKLANRSFDNFLYIATGRAREVVKDRASKDGDAEIETLKAHAFRHLFEPKPHP